MANSEDLWEATKSRDAERVKILLAAGALKIYCAHNMICKSISVIKWSENVEIFRLWLEYVKDTNPAVFYEMISKYGHLIMKFTIEYVSEYNLSNKFITILEEYGVARIDE